MKLIDKKYEELLESISDILKQGRRTAFQKVDNILVETYWNIGKRIVEYEQNGKEKAEYGSTLLQNISKDLKIKLGKGFSKSNIYSMRLFYLKYSNFQTVSGKLSWSKYCELLPISDDLSRSFYEQQCINDDWSVRELKRQINSGLFERIALSKNKNGVLELSKKGITIKDSEDVVKEPYIFEFIKMPETDLYSERDLENGLVDKMSQFLLELGKGFAFIAKQQRITLNNTHFYVDLVFYHRILKCFVLIDLKKGKVDHKDIGQMNMYLNYFKSEENAKDDNEPIGIVLAAGKDDILVEYATGGLTNKLFVSKYQLYLPDKEELKRELSILMENNTDE